MGLFLNSRHLLAAASVMGLPRDALRCFCCIAVLATLLVAPALARAQELPRNGAVAAGNASIGTARTVEVPALPPRRPMEADRAQALSDLDRIAFATPTLAPIAHTHFCMKYPNDCQVQGTVLDAGPITLTRERRAELVRINAKVNHAIHWTRMHDTPSTEKWVISPKFGDCNDYAVTKRHDLLALGWPSRDLLLAEVVTTWGEHHLVLVVRTDKGDLVADSIDKRIRNWAVTPYRWVRVETPSNPKFWATIQPPLPDRIAMAGHDNQL